jgi:phenylalanyl-tRNA synthetase beta chain
VQAGGRDVGWVGALHPTVGAAWEIPQMIVAAELDLSSLLDTPVHLPRYEPLSRTFGSTRDAAMLVARTTHWEAVESALARLRNPLLQRWELFDVYTGDGIAGDAMSLAVRFYYAKTDTSLTDEQVDRAHARTLLQLETEVGAQFRT